MRRLALKMTFAPFKQFGLDYNLRYYLEYLKGADVLEKLIENGLAEQYNQIYGKKSVKLVGYDYVQYNKDDWSYYPVQLIVKSKPQGLIWIKWKCERSGNYFEFNSTDEKNLERLPVKYSFCSDDENNKLFIEFPQPTLDYDICSRKNIKFYLYSVQLDISSIPFNFEYQRQMTSLYSEITGIPDIQKYLLFGTFVVRHALNKDGYTYAKSKIFFKPHWETDPNYQVIIRWKSNIKKEYISPLDNVGNEDITFEFSPVIPPEYEFAKHNLLNIADKNDIINFIESNPHRKQPDSVFGTYFDVKVESMSYPDISFILEFKSKLNDSQIQKLTLQISEYLEKYNSASDNKIHNYDITAESEKQIKLFIDFGNTGEDAIKGLFTFLNTIKNIKVVTIS